MAFLFQILAAQKRKVSKITFRLRLRMRIHDYHVCMVSVGSFFIEERNHYCASRARIVAENSFLWCPKTMSKGLRMQNNGDFGFIVYNVANCPLSLFCFFGSHGRI